MKMNKILIAGEGGQGVQVIAKILTDAAFNSGFFVTNLPNFGVEQRGGVSLAYVQISKEKISFPKFDKADIVVVFTKRAIKRIESTFHKETLLIFDNSLISEKELKDIHLPKVAIPATNLAKEKLVPKVFNVIILGALVAEVGGIKEGAVTKALEKVFAGKYKSAPQLKHFNKKAFELGVEAIGSIKKG